MLSALNYLYWRPYTAIRNANFSNNPMISADPNWQPLLSTPNHPEYPAAHGCLTGALGEIFANLAGSQHINLAMQGSTNGGTTLAATRHFDTVQAMDQELVNARVWAGLHFRTSAETGLDVGQNVAAWSLQRYFRSVERVSVTRSSVTVTFASRLPGTGRVYFGPGAG